MANFELKFIDQEWDFITIESNVNCRKDLIMIKLNIGKSYNLIGLDKSTAIKFAKTLRTEINKITEEEVSNG